MEDQVMFRLRQGLFDNRSRHAEPTVVAENGANGSAGFDAVRRGIVKPDLVQDSVYVFFYRRDIGFAERPVLAAEHSRTYGFLIHRQRRIAQRMACLSSAGSSRHI
jgi:hypothetical protein